MDKRIRIVYAVSIITMLLVILAQAYWLWTQYQFSASTIMEQMKPTVTRLIAAEQETRYNRYVYNLPERTASDTVKINIKVDIDRNKHGHTDASSTITYELGKGKKVSIKVQDMSMRDANDIYDRYKVSLHLPFQKQLIDSLLMEKGYNKSRDFKRLRGMKRLMQPQYSASGSWRKGLRVSYCSNPMLREGFCFTIPMPTSGIVKQMAWQLGVSFLLIIIIVFCFYYQLKTIVIQKRIDGIRREFIKNMMYERKQPADDGAADDCLRVGETEFRYSLNELRHGNERVILTSRQAEIFRLLAASPNVMVSREQLLNECWGDDSYQNSLALNVQITYLRRAIKGDETISIDVIYKKGYVLTVK